MCRFHLVPFLLACVGLWSCGKADTTAAPDEAAPGDEAAAEGEGDDEDSGDAASHAHPAPESPEPMLTTTIFEQTVQQHMDDALDCYTQARKKKPKLGGRLLADFTIDAEGKITEVKPVEGSTLTDKGLVACIQEKAKSWSLPKPPSGQATNMQFPFDLEPD